MTGVVVRFPASRCPVPDPLFAVPTSRVIIDTMVLVAAIRAGAAAAPIDTYGCAIHTAALAMIDAEDRLPALPPAEMP